MNILGGSYLYSNKTVLNFQTIDVSSVLFIEIAVKYYDASLNQGLYKQDQGSKAPSAAGLVMGKMFDSKKISVPHGSP